jgi:hypothetical protein
MRLKFWKTMNILMQVTSFRVHWYYSLWIDWMQSSPVQCASSFYNVQTLTRTIYYIHRLWIKSDDRRDSWVRCCYHGWKRCFWERWCCLWWANILFRIVDLAAAERYNLKKKKGCKNAIRLARAILDYSRVPDKLGRVPPLWVIDQYNQAASWYQL